MKTHPILFNTSMMDAILQGRKTQTRRGVNFKKIAKKTGCTKGTLAYSDTFNSWGVLNGNGDADLCLYEAPIKKGYILWVRETWQYSDDLDNPYLYRQKYEDEHIEEYHKMMKWKPSIFMPKDACRLFLEVITVKVERLQDISEEDALAEGVKSAACESTKSCVSCLDECQDNGTFWDYMNPSGECGFPCESAKESFFSLWESINGKESLDNNPWVWVYEFKIVEQPKGFL